MATWVRLAFVSVVSVVVAALVAWPVAAQMCDPISEVGYYDTTGTAYDVAVSGNYAYVADGAGGLRVIDISSPASPTEVGHYVTEGAARSVTISGNYAYVADDTFGMLTGGLEIYDITTPNSPALLSTRYVEGRAMDVFLVGNYAYVASTDDLTVFDVSSPTNPTEAGNSGGFGVNCVAVDGNYAYGAGEDDWSALMVFNSNPVAPTFTWSMYDTPGYITCGLDLAGSYAYLASWPDAAINVIDISNPLDPQGVGIASTMDRPYGVAVSGNYAYVADNTAGLSVFDVSNPTMPALVGSYNTPGNAYGVTISGNYAYVADGAAGLRIISVLCSSTPTPTPAASSTLTINVEFGSVFGYADDIIGAMLAVVLLICGIYLGWRVLRSILSALRAGR